MEKMTQKTLENSAEIAGIGLHTGEASRLVFKPAPVDTGIIFFRTNVPNSEPVKAGIDNLLDNTKFPRRTSIGNSHFQIHTIEHLLSALYAMEIDNLFIEMEGNECPGLDGSSKPFIDIFKKAGIKNLHKEKEVLYLKEPIYISSNGSHIIALPNDSLKISYTLDYPETILKSQYASYKITPEIYENNIASARTFCLKDEVESLRKMGLGKGSDYSNTLVIDDEKGVIDNEFRFPDEPVRHKINDLLGDLAVLINYVRAHIIGIRSGHALNTKLIRKIQEQNRADRLGGVGSPSPTIARSNILSIEEIEKIIPHRFPFLLVDRIIDLTDSKAVGIKNVTMNEWFFEGHFPNKPVMPGVLIIEAMAQVGGVLMLSKEENRGKLAYFMSIDNAKFRKAVSPGDQLLLEVEVIKLKSRIGQLQGKTYVNGKLATEASFKCTIIDA